MIVDIEADGAAIVATAQTTTSNRRRTMKIKANVKPGGSLNHTQTLVREAKKNLRVKTKIKSGVFKTIKLTA
jgi:hypothetical protein